MVKKMKAKEGEKLFSLAAILVISVLAMFTATVASADDPSETATGWVVGDINDSYGTILHTTDGGNTWERQGSAAEIPHVDLGGVSAVDSNTAWVVGLYGVILYTTDGGNTWTRQGVGQIPNVNLLGVSAVDRNNAWAVGQNGTILHTTDGGNTWEQQGVGTIPDVVLQGVCAVDHETAWVTGDFFHGYASIFHTTDGGNNWTRQGSAAELSVADHIIGVSAADSNNAWAVGGFGALIFHTTDGGSTWVDQTPSAGPDVDVNDVFAVDANTVWAAMDFGNIFYTENGGENWTKQPVSHDATGYYLLGVSAIDADTAWIVGEVIYKSEGIILHTTNGGNNWTEQTPPANAGFGEVSFAPLRVHKLRVEKSDNPDPVLAGGTLNYSISVNNAGSVTATNVTVTETYDKNVTFVAAVPAPSSGDDTWQFPTLNVSEMRWINISVTVNASTPNGTVLHNVVNVSCAEGVTDTDTENTTVFVAPVPASCSHKDQLEISDPRSTFVIPITDGS